MKITGACYEIAIDGSPRSYRDRKELAIEAATFLKTKHPNAQLTVRDLETGETIAVKRAAVILPTPITANMLFSALAPSELALLVPHCRATTFEVGQTIQEAEVPVEQVWFPFSGIIALGVDTIDGGLIETAVIGSDGVVGALVGPGAWRAFYRAVVVARGHGVAIPALRFQEIARGSESVRNLILAKADPTEVRPTIAWTTTALSNR